MTRSKVPSGSTLIVTIMLLTVVSTFVAVAFKFSQRTAVSARSLSRAQSAEAIANGCLELAFSSWRQISRNTTPVGLVNGTLTDGITGETVSYYSPPPSEAFASLMLPQATMFPDIEGFSATRTARTANETVSNYRIQAVDPLITLASSSSLDGPISSLASIAWPTFSLTAYNSTGLWGPKSYYYLASADVTLPTRSGPRTTRVRQVFEKRLASPFQFALFFMDDLEIHPSYPSTLFGAVHTNGKFYTGTGNLTFDSTVPPLLNNSASAQLSGPEAINRYPGISYGEEWIVGFKPGDSFHSGPPQPPIISSGIPPGRVGKLQPYDIDPSSWDASDSNPNNDGFHEIIESAVSPGTNPDPLARKLYTPASGAHAASPADNAYGWNNLYNITRRLRDACGIQIECDSTAGTVTIKRRDGTILTGSPIQYGPAAGPVLLPPYADAYALQSVYTAYYPNALAPPGSGGAVKLGDTIQDPREGGTVKLITIDCAKIWDWNHTHTHGPHVALAALDGILYPPDQHTHQLLKPESLMEADSIYVTDTSVNWAAGNRVAVRLKNCGRMPLKTIVTDLPLYIQGDFNTGTITSATRQSTNDLAWQTSILPAYPEPAVNDATVPGTNYDNLNMPNDTGFTSAPGRSSIPNYTRFPCVVVSDAVTVLSNNWNDANSSLGLGSRVARNTTINCSIVSGNVPTSGGNYSGGAENFIRLLEDWSDKRLTVVGSQIQMWPSKFATGTWGQANVYDEPSQRLWYPEPLIQNVLGSGSSVGSVFINNAPELMLVAYLRHRWFKE